jgi:hypothetical protein
MEINYEEKLHSSLAHTTHMNAAQIAFCLMEYKTKAGRTSPEMAFAELIESRSNETIEQALERISKEPGLDINPVTRLEAYRKNLERCGGKLDVEIVTVPDSELAPHQLADLQKIRAMKKPSECVPRFIHSEATFKGERGLELEIKL